MIEKIQVIADPISGQRSIVAQIAIGEPTENEAKLTQTEAWEGETLEEGIAILADVIADNL